VRKHWYKPWTWDYPRAYGALLALTAFAIMVGVLYDRSQQNKQAIEKSCILLNNAIVRSTKAQTDPDSPSIPLVRGILAVIPRKYATEYAVRSRTNMTVIPLIDCHTVADHPEDIHAEQLPSVSALPPRIPINKK
jgi:hypothetical protein